MSRTSHLNVNLNDKKIIDDFQKNMLNHLKLFGKKIAKNIFLAIRVTKK
jgi:hypothetical protein